MFDEDSQLWIHLCGLPMRLTEGDLACILSQYGEILEISSLRKDERGGNENSCFIKYESKTNCDRAVHYLHGIKLLGHKLDVIYANELHTKSKRTPQKELDEKTTNKSSSAGRNSRLLSDDDLVTSIRDQTLEDADCLSKHVKTGQVQDEIKQGKTFVQESREAKKESKNSTPSKHRQPGISSSTRSCLKHRDSNSPTESSKSQNRTPRSYERDHPFRYRYHSPYDSHYSNSSTVHRFREDSPVHRRRRSSPISPIRFASRRRIPSPSSPSDARSREYRNSHSPRRKPYSSPNRESETYRHNEYRYHSRYFHQSTELSSGGRYRRSTSRCFSRSPQRERSRSRYRSSSQLRDRSSSQRRDRSRSNHRDRTSRSSSSSGRPDRVSSTSQTRSKSSQRDFDSSELRSYYKKQIDDLKRTQERGRKSFSSEIKNDGVGATGISLILERRLNRHYETNGI